MLLLSRNRGEDGLVRLPTSTAPSRPLVDGDIGSLIFDLPTDARYPLGTVQSCPSTTVHSSTARLSRLNHDEVARNLYRGNALFLRHPRIHFWKVLETLNTLERNNSACSIPVVSRGSARAARGPELCTTGQIWLPKALRSSGCIQFSALRPAAARRKALTQCPHTKRVISSWHRTRSGFH